MSLAGGKLKETGTTYWISPNTGATNETGFTALPGGGRYGYSPPFRELYINGYWWSTTNGNSMEAYYWTIGYGYSSIVRDLKNKTSGFSVRCLKD